MNFERRFPGERRRTRQLAGIFAAGLAKIYASLNEMRQTFQQPIIPDRTTHLRVQYVQQVRASTA